ncbi:hypothetical protein GCM10023328_47830 [Modestobacter marinus]|uniref:Uncharacterized membrane protein YgaE (UPF0421/DUF939 family) n=1 Tax=Modestobacter marinus TaxID=477641 RepID=A0A846LV43_9ACTN|nr:hypothetical protein [Modestobacter marinus]NIH70232.1 uncharacterized membrane protein YgaE (UPF0421/DUF939 family) [Modestobacter marinus]GGL85709.1 hypothetical protein GCM10011589_47640 [Modestobacter marinus]
MPQAAQEYPYYAPFGAVIAISTTLAGSARTTAQSVSAIAIGAVVALAVDALPVPTVARIGVVVTAGMLLAGWHRLGSSGSWVPTSALFVLIIGGGDPVDYVLGFAGLTFAGALIGTAVLAVFPPLPLAPSQTELGRLRDLLAAQLADLAEGLQQEHPPTEDEWRERIHTIDPVLARMRAAVQQTDEARRGNLRARRHQQDADRQYAQARALERLTLMVEDLTQLIAETETADLSHVALGPALRPSAVSALAGLADVLRSVEGPAAEPDTTRAAYDELHVLETQLRRARQSTDDDLFAASSIALAIRRCLAAVVPEELAEEDMVD